MLLFLPYTQIKDTKIFCVLVFNMICLSVYMPTKHVFIDQISYWSVLRVYIGFEPTWQFRNFLIDPWRNIICRSITFEYLSLIAFNLINIFIVHVFCFIFLPYYLSLNPVLVQESLFFWFKEGKIEQSLFELFLLLAQHLNY